MRGKQKGVKRGLKTGTEGGRGGKGWKEKGNQKRGFHSKVRGNDREKGEREKEPHVEIREGV